MFKKDAENIYSQKFQQTNTPLLFYTFNKGIVNHTTSIHQSSNSSTPNTAHIYLKCAVFRHSVSTTLTTSEVYLLQKGTQPTLYFPCVPRWSNLPIS